MRFVRYPQLNPLKASSCVTIGNFDGMHLGHQALVKTVVERARLNNQQAVVVTMQPLPLQHFNGPYSIEILTPFKHKYQILKSLGVDVMCCLNFNSQLASMVAHAFFEDILLKGLNANYLLVGDDFKFGADRQGDFKMLQALATESAMSVDRMHSILIGEKRVSSTSVRSHLRAGEFSAVKGMLGRDFNVIGRVAHGKKLGRTLGYPTINLELKHGAFPLHGIYVVSIIIAGIRHPAVASVGFNPSVGGNAKRIEVYVLDFDQQIYGQSVEVLFYKKLRNEVEFDSLTALTSAIESDVKKTREYFAKKSGELV